VPLWMWVVGNALVLLGVAAYLDRNKPPPPPGPPPLPSPLDLLLYTHQEPDRDGRSGSVLRTG